MGMNARVKRAKKRKLLNREGRTCWLCGKRMGRFDSITLDHIIPVSRGGSNDIENLKLAHAECNNARGNADGIAFERMAA